MRRVLYFEEKLTPQSPLLLMSSISFTYSFLFSQTLPSQTYVGEIMREEEEKALDKMKEK